MIYILMIALCVLLYFSFILNKKDLIAPSFVFCVSFCFSCIWAVAYAKEWDLGLHSNTFWVILGGVLEFIIFSYIIQSAFSLVKGKNSISGKSEPIKIKIENWKKILFLMFCIFTIFYSVYSIVRVMNGSFSNVAESIYAYRNISIFSDESIPLPKLMVYSRYAVNAAGYWFAYIIINNYLVEKKVDILSVLIVIMSMISSMTTGGRNGAVNIILACVAIFFILLNKKNGFHKSIRFKTMVQFIVIAIVVLWVFQTIGTLLGRTTSVDTNTMDYLAKYCGAEIKNLDLFLQENYSTSNNNIWGSQTFIYIIRWLGPKFGIKNTYYALTLPYRTVNGFNLGNVYTTFYPYIYDFGYIGLVCLVGLMAVITQWVYERGKRIKLKKSPAMCIMIYGYMFSSIALSFFSNKFYEQNFNRQFIIAILFWLFYDVLFCKLKFIKTKN